MSDDYEVGYGKPPRETRFKPGQSGNPKGRTRGSKNLSTLIKAALSEKVVSNVAGRRRKLSKLEVAFIQQANKAAGGDLKATKLMVELMNQADAREAGQSNNQVSPQERRSQHERVLQALLAQSQAQGGEDGGEN